jgi:hypothetical protein
MAPPCENPTNTGNEHGRRAEVVLVAQANQGAADILDVVRDRQLAVLARHPVGDNGLLPRVEGMQRLHRGDEPSVHAGDPFEGRQMNISRLRIPMKADQHRPWWRNAGGADEHATMRACLDVQRRPGRAGHSV